jgi:predicted RNA-binding protein with EMAP domain
MIKHIPISVGEFVDKISILQIKLDKINNFEKLNNISKELEALIFLDNEKIVGTLDYQELKEVNLKLWEVEDLIRIKEARQDFGEEFIQLARSVYQLNDIRANLKRKINIKYSSELIEEKSYE